ncbi:MAG TPA: hypothetical protein VI670_28555 [Thermoanaerobaculia bacterium]|jgi:hypothetical protein
MIKNLRFASISLFLLSWFTFKLVRDREHLRDVVVAIERRVVMATILDAELPESDELPYVPHDQEVNVEDAIRAYSAFHGRGEMYALGQMWDRLPLRYERATRMIGGGRLYFATQYGHNTVDSYIDTFREDDHIAWCPPLKPDKAVREEDRVFFLPINVQRDTESPSDLIGGNFTFVATNYEFDRSTAGSEMGCARPGRQLLIVVDRDSDFSSEELTTVDDLNAEALVLGRQIGVIRDDAAHTYMEARTRLESGRVTVPVVGGDVEARSAVAVAQGAMLMLLAWVAFTLRTIAVSPTVTDDPVGPKELVNLWHRSSVVHRPALICEFILWLAFHVGTLISPFVVFVEVQKRLIVAQEVGVEAYALVVVAILTFSALFSLVALVRQAWPWSLRQSSDNEIYPI